MGCAQSEPNFSNNKNNKMNSLERKSVENLLRNYETELNAANTKAIVKLYSEDGIFMPSEAPTSIGKEQVEAAYNFVFSQIKLTINFTFDEIEIQGDLAFARTISKGNVEVFAAGITVPEENRELFILKKKNGLWKIHRYIFNKMTAPVK